MTPDLDTIRAALAARKGAQYGVERHAFNENASTWLAALVEEVERLRAEYDEANGVWKETLKHTMAERDAALADLDIANRRGDEWRNLSKSDNLAAIAKIQQLRVERDAWRACAERLAACFDDWMRQAAPVGEALAEYERLA